MFLDRPLLKGYNGTMKAVRFCVTAAVFLAFVARKIPQERHFNFKIGSEFPGEAVLQFGLKRVKGKAKSDGNEKILSEHGFAANISLKVLIRCTFSFTLYLILENMVSEHG